MTWMDGSWSEDSFLLGSSSSLANHGGLAHLLFYILPTYEPDIVTRY